MAIGHFVVLKESGLEAKSTSPSASLLFAPARRTLATLQQLAPRHAANAARRSAAAHLRGEQLLEATAARGRRGKREWQGCLKIDVNNQPGAIYSSPYWLVYHGLPKFRVGPFLA